MRQQESRHCVAVIGDIVESKTIQPGLRLELQNQFRAEMERLNERYSDAVLANFIITTGDEFQVLLRTADVVPDIIWSVEYGLYPYKIRFGIGRGVLHTRLEPNAISMDGPVWYRARDAVERATRDRRLGGVFAGFEGSHDEVLTNLATLLRYLREEMTEKQMEVVDQLREGLTQLEVARNIGIDRTSVTRRATGAAWRTYQVGEEALRLLLAPYNYIEQWNDA